MPQITLKGNPIQVAGADLKTGDTAPNFSLQDNDLAEVAFGASAGKNRIIANSQEIVTRQPDIIIGSWCGKKFRPERVAARPGWHDVPAVSNAEIHEIKSALILQPGPAALTEGLQELQSIIDRWRLKARA